MNNPTIPDYISPIVGYRVWIWHTNQIWSLNGEAWAPGHALTAKCPNTNHASPADDCACGIYAVNGSQQLEKVIKGFGYGLHGEVCLWGKVVEHDLGYRAQFAYPKSLVLPFHIKPDLDPSELTTYGADVYLPPNILLWEKGSGYTSAGLDWLSGRGRPCGKWCEEFHQRAVHIGDCVLILGRGAGLVERDDWTSEYASHSVYIRLLHNNDVYIVPQQDVTFACNTWIWIVDPRRYNDAVILRSSTGWKILCDTREQKCSFTQADAALGTELRALTGNSLR